MASPAFDRRHLCFSNLRGLVVHVQEKVAKLGVELTQRQRWLATYCSAGRRIAFQFAQKHLVHRGEESFDTPAAPRLSGNREYQSDFQLRTHLFQMLGREVAPIVRGEAVMAGKKNS